MNEAILELVSVRKSFVSDGDNLEILSGIDLSVPESTKTVIIGDSGCGKSTLLNIIGGLDSVSGGSIRAGQYHVHALDERDMSVYRSSFLGLVFQFHYLLKDFTALENVMLPAFMAGMKKKEALNKAKSLLADVHLEHRMHHYPSQMSGGERQRASVARSLINDPSLVLADEPTGNLDPFNAENVRELLFSVVTSYNKTLIMVTHDQSIASLADTCYRLHNGRLYEQ